MPDLPQRHAKPKAKGVTKHEVEGKAWGTGAEAGHGVASESASSSGMATCASAQSARMKRIATEVDHIIPLSQGGTDDDSNLMAIAGYPCHARKTARESAASRK